VPPDPLDALDAVAADPRTSDEHLRLIVANLVPLARANGAMAQAAETSAAEARAAAVRLEQLLTEALRRLPTPEQAAGERAGGLARLMLAVGPLLTAEHIKSIIGLAVVALQVVALVVTAYAMMRGTPLPQAPLLGGHP